MSSAPDRPIRRLLTFLVVVGAVAAAGCGKDRGEVASAGAAIRAGPGG